jgi:hypothetical protein
VTKDTTAKAVIETIKVHFGEEVSYRIANLCIHRLMSGGLGQHQYSFQLLPEYRDMLELKSLGTLVDLQTDQQTGEPLFYFLIIC